MSAAQKKPRLYIGCSLTMASEEFRDQVEQLKVVLRAQGYKIDDFLGLTAGTPREVYLWDIKECVANCDVMVGICDEPSIGLGYELCEAVRLGKPVLAVAHKQVQVTRMIAGIAEVEKNFAFERYNDLVTDVPQILDDHLPTLRQYANLISVVNGAE